ncbi:MAG: shikimate kinase [Bacteroidales bacterium]|nr:shikimate kinase [Bacteroidales bacterium]
MERIFLIGYMGAGKSRLGRMLAEALGWSFVDLDVFIEEKYAQKIPSLFESRGEEGFRLIERECLHEVAEFKRAVISTGGGTPCYADNMEYMNRSGETLYLKVAVPELLRRLLSPKSQGKRPLLAGLSPEQMEEKIVRMLQLREPYYLRAKHQYYMADEQSHEHNLQGLLVALGL